MDGATATVMDGAMATCQKAQWQHNTNDGNDGNGGYGWCNGNGDGRRSGNGWQQQRQWTAVPCSLRSLLTLLHPLPPPLSRRAPRWPRRLMPGGRWAGAATTMWGINLVVHCHCSCLCLWRQPILPKLRALSGSIVLTAIGAMLADRFLAGKASGA